jgi:Mlc titration factor MtfA (ptsG expression regulator)
MDLNLFTKFLLLIGLVPIILYLIKLPKLKRRRRLYKLPFPESWEIILNENFSLYRKLPEPLKRQLHGHMHIFLNEKNFVGYNGIEINETIRVVIAAQACLLLLNRKTNYYPHLTNILVYPNAFTSKEPNGEPRKIRLGESWHRGPIVLSWMHSKQGAHNAQDGENVVMHEFAHQLDQENGPSDGLPILQHNHIKQWSTVLGKEFKSLKLKLKMRKRSLLNKYGATNPAEFFAVITEHFIEQPQELLKKHPKLYQELRKYYQINPIEWV